MNIILVCSYFGPETSVGVNRVNAMTRYWLDLGCSIDVITMPFSEELPEYLQNKQQLIIHQVNPYFFKKKNAVSSTSKNNSENMIKKKLQAIFYFIKKHFFANYLDYRVLWWPRAAQKAKEILKIKHIDYIFTSVPSYTAHSVGAMVKCYAPHIYWVADYRDLWFGNPIFPGFALVRFIEYWHEKLILNKADMLVTINQDMGAFLTKLHKNKKLIIVPNGFDNCDIDVTSLEKIDHITCKRIVFTGTVLPGLQNAEPLFEAVCSLLISGQLHPDDLRIYFYGNSNSIKKTKNFIYLLNIGIIFLKGRISRKASIAAQKTADLLLFLGSKQVKNGTNTQGVVSGKIFEYLFSGTEIMAVGVSNDMVVSEIICKSEVGDIYNEDIHKIATRLLLLVREGKVQVTPNLDYLAQFRREDQAIYLLSEIQKGIVEKRIMNVL